MSRDEILRDIAGKLPVVPSAGRRRVWLLCMVIGIASLAFLFATQPQRAWGAWAINTLYFLGIAQGAVVLACAIRLANGRWGGPVMRIAESLSAFLPYGIGLMLILLIGGIWTYLPWAKHVEPRQAAYLNVPFLYVRPLVGLGLLWWLSRKLVRISLRTDCYLLKNHVDPRLKPEYEKLCDGWRGDEQEAAWQRNRLAHLAPQIVVLYAVVFTLLAWDFVMSLTPSWTSTLFGWWFFMAAFLSGIATTALLTAQLRIRYKLEAYLNPDHMQDIGKIAFGFCTFWVYEFWAQYLVIWYGNLPEETWWVFLRFEAPWRILGFTVFAMVFLVPFLGLMNMRTKRNTFWLSFFSLVILAGLWLERHILVMPSLNPTTRWVGLPEVGVALGFLGVFGWAVQGFLARYPVVKVVAALAPPGPPEH